MSADKYFEEFKGGVFHPLHLRAAHNYCKDKFREHMKGPKHRVVVDNTNSQLWEYQEYVKLTEAEGCNRLVILELEVNCRSDVFQCNSRSLHDVPRENSIKMHERWEKDERAILLEPFPIKPEKPLQK